jgi:hypothetical protein
MSIADNLIKIKSRIDSALKQAQRKDSVRLVAVSKAQTIGRIEQAFLAGQRDFAENYLQEALQKIQALKSFPIEWHYIGNVQSNKTRQIAANFTWVHSVCDERIAHRLNAFRLDDLLPLNVCVQINLQPGSARLGVPSTRIEDFLLIFAELKNLRLRGLMVFPDLIADAEQQEKIFLLAHKTFQRLQLQYSDMDTLSMGTSSDLESAIICGSNLVRVGTAIFGARQAGPMELVK